MNAAEQANSLETTTKIASVVNLFKAAFPDARPDLKPWANDPDTQELIDPDSIDIGFNFPGFSRSLQSRCILLQIRFHNDLETGDRRAVGIELAGFDHRGKQWWLSTVDHWIFEGESCPTPEMAEQIKTYLKQILDLFNPADH